MNLQRSLVLPALFIITMAAARAQAVVAGGGGHHANANTAITYTIGEPVINTVSAGNTTLTQGFNQPWAHVSTMVGDGLGPTPAINVYPNPVRHTLHIAMDKPADKHYSLHDAAGRLADEGRIIGTVTDLDMEQHASGGYILRVTDGTTFSRAFRISVTH